MSFKTVFDPSRRLHASNPPCASGQKYLMRNYFVPIAFACACVTALSGCLPKEEHKLQVVNGFVLGDREGPAQSLIVGVGDSAQRLIERNPFLRPLGIDVNRPLNLPLMTKLDVTYDDGSVKLKLGCAMRAGLDGDREFPGVSYAGFGLCESNVNDWQAATRQTTALIQEFLRTHPDAQDLKPWLATAAREDWVSLAGDIGFSRHVLSEAQANARWADLAARGHPFDVTQDSFMDVGVFQVNRTLVIFSVSKDPNVLGETTKMQKPAMNYRAGVGFLLSKDGARIK
jgi:hypothetical protein